MAIEIRGMNNLLKKLDNLSNLKTKEIVKEVANSTAEAVKEGASWSEASHLAGEVKVRDFGLTCYIDVGFSSDKVPFEQWKSLWFQHWGFNDYGLNFTGQFYINNHKNWFEDTINEHAKAKQKELKARLRQEVRKNL